MLGLIYKHVLDESIVDWGKDYYSIIQWKYEPTWMSNQEQIHALGKLQNIKWKNNFKYDFIILWFCEILDHETVKAVVAHHSELMVQINEGVN